jgi:hypothetical protein
VHFKFQNIVFSIYYFRIYSYIAEKNINVSHVPGSCGKQLVPSEKHNLGWSSQETFVVEIATGLLQSLPQNCLA